MHKIINKRYRKSLQLLSLIFMLLLHGCGQEEKQLETKEPIEMNNVSTYYIEKDKTLFLTDYEEYKDYLTNENPSYDLLYKTVQENRGIPQKYKKVFNKIISLFEINEIPTQSLGIFYENLIKEEVNTNFTIDNSKNTSVAAFFIPDPDTPSINIDENAVDFYTILHEVIHSCYEAQIYVGDKIAFITSKGIKIEDLGDNLLLVEFYGNSFSEAQAEYVAQSLYKGDNRLMQSSYSYNINSSILAFFYQSLAMDIPEFFSYHLKDFENKLLQMGIEQEKIDCIISAMDSLLETNESGLDACDSFYKYFIPKLIDEYIKRDYSVEEMYQSIGEILKTSVIEQIKEEDSLSYCSFYLNTQKEAFDNIDFLIRETLWNYGKETSTIYNYIGHEFQIYYSLYGADAGITSGNFYLSHNWDMEAAKNCDLFLYVEDNHLKMCSAVENGDGTFSLFNHYGEIQNVKNGIYLIDLINAGMVTIEDGYLQFTTSINSLTEKIKEQFITCRYEKDIVLQAENCYFYFSEGKGVICNITTNASGEVIPYQIGENQIFLLPENAQQVGAIDILIKKEIITFDCAGKCDIDIERLNQFLANNKQMLTK